MAEGQEDLFQELIQAFQETLRILRSVQRGGQGLLSQLARSREKRALIERGNHELRWNENLRQATQDMSPAERTQLLERHAEVVLQNDALEAQRNALLARNQELQQQNAAGDERLRQQDAELNGDRDRDGIPDDIENRTDLDRDHRDDATERRDEVDQQNDEANDRDGDGVDDAVQDREREQAQADEERRKQQEQEEQDRRRDEQGADGIDPGAVETAAAAGLAAGELDNELDRDRADDNLQQGLDENGEPLDPANEADNELETGTDDAERGQVDPAAAAEAGLDADDRQHQDELGQSDPSQDQPGLGDQGQESGLDAGNELNDPSRNADNALDDPSQSADNAVDDRSRDADNAVEADASQEGPSPYATDESDRDSQTVDTADPALDSDLNRDDGQQTDVSADQDGADPSVAADDRGTDGLQQDQSDLGQDAQQVDPQDVDSQQAAPQVDGQQPTGQQVSPEQVDAPGAEAPGAEGPQAEAPQVDAQQAPEQGADQVPQVNGAGAQQIANASETAVNETTEPGQDGQGTDAQTSEAKGSQWRPPEQPAIDEARANQPNGQQSGPSRDLPPDEEAKLKGIRDDQEPLSSVKTDNAAVAAGARPGTPAAQRTADRGRNDGRSNDSGGRGRGE